MLLTQEGMSRLRSLDVPWHGGGLVKAVWCSRCSCSSSLFRQNKPMEKAGAVWRGDGEKDARTRTHAGQTAEQRLHRLCCRHNHYRKSFLPRRPYNICHLWPCPMLPVLHSLFKIWSFASFFIRHIFVVFHLNTYFLLNSFIAHQNEGI